MQDIFFYFDDSGVLTKKTETPFFVYGGIYFLDNQSKEKCKYRYKSVSNKIKKHLHISGELKACKIKENKYKKALLRISYPFNTLSLVVKIDQVYDNILCDKKAIHRYKDYVLKRIIKKAIQQEIQKGKIIPSEKTHLHIYIDEQATSTNGFYDLKSSIYEELKNGISNFDYGVYYPSIFKGPLKVTVNYCDSSKNWLIQQSDIIANRVWSAYVKKETQHIDNFKNHIHEIFP